eukprot:NODE_30683_length_412_cov_3.080702.p2 GENE.NODE_30683_length_412_cov_3.080702~~NODE_30683_length_412_cov_3.080702.p2  ORF type:complete len:84 (+),score=13.39 NODE_30683_length_412_cov_3.080702:155-406(+)
MAQSARSLDVPHCQPADRTAAHLPEPQQRPQAMPSVPQLQQDIVYRQHHRPQAGSIYRRGGSCERPQQQTSSVTHRMPGEATL